MYLYTSCASVHVCVFKALAAAGGKIIPRVPRLPTPQHTLTYTPQQNCLVRSDSARANTLRQTISTHSTRPGGENTGLERKYQYSPPPTGCFFRGMSLYGGVFIASMCMSAIKASLILTSTAVLTCRPHCVGNQS